MRGRCATAFGHAVWLLAGLSAGVAESSGDSRRGMGRVGRPGPGSADGGAFSLDGEVVSRQAPRGGGYVLEVEPRDAARGATAGCHCFDLVFSDGFESGDTGAWDVP